MILLYREYNGGIGHFAVSIGDLNRHGVFALSERRSGCIAKILPVYLGIQGFAVNHEDDIQRSGSGYHRADKRHTVIGYACRHRRQDCDGRKRADHGELTGGGAPVAPPIGHGDIGAIGAADKQIVGRVYDLGIGVVKLILIDRHAARVRRIQTRNLNLDIRGNIQRIVRSNGRFRIPRHRCR